MHPLHSEAVKEMAQTLRTARDEKRPTSVLIGAGLSKTAGIPLALELVEAIYKRYDGRLRGLDRAASNIYGEAMAMLTAKERKGLLEPFMRDAKVNWAHIALAQLMRDGFVSRALSLNFDSLLVRACAITGVTPAVYDLSAFDPLAAGTIVDPSILYLHGQSYGFKQLNTAEETQHTLRG